MGLLDKLQTNNSNGSKKLDLNKEELKFILAKLRSAEYKGTEFELFYQVFTKIQDYLV